MRQTFITTVVILIFLVPFVLSQPILYGNLHITPSVSPYQPYNSTSRFYITVTNGTAFLNSTQATCYFYLKPASTTPILYAFKDYSQDSQYTEVNLSGLSAGFYPYDIICNTSNQIGMVSDTFELTEGGSISDAEIGGKTGVILGSVFIPLLFAIMLLYGSAKLGKGHDILMLFSVLLMPFLVIMAVKDLVLSLAHFYHFPELQIALSRDVYVYGSVSFIIFSYFALLIIYQRFWALRHKGGNEKW